MKYIATIITCLFITGCREPGTSVLETSNPKIEIVLLFEVNGIKMYRFVDGGKTIYFSDTRGETVSETGTKKHPSTQHVETIK